MGLFDGPSERLRLGFQPVDVDTQEALDITWQVLREAAQSLGLEASGRRAEDGGYMVRVKSIDRAGGTILDGDIILWFFIGPRKRIAALADRFLSVSLDRPQVLCVSLPETY